MNELNELQKSLTSDITSSVQTDITNQLSGMLMALVIPSIIVTLLIAVFYIMRIVHRHKVDKAIFEIRDTLREMKASQANTTIPSHNPELVNRADSIPTQVDNS